jgi:hypothetical protein
VAAICQEWPLTEEEAKLYMELWRKHQGLDQADTGKLHMEIWRKHQGLDQEDTGKLEIGFRESQ